MKQVLTIDAAIERDNGLLLQVVGALRELKSPPESFIWSHIPGSNEGRIWMVVVDDEATIQELIAFLGLIPGITNVAHQPG